MRDVLILAIHLLVTLVKLPRPGGVRADAAESLLLKHQLLISNRPRHRAPNLTTFDRVVLGLTTLIVNPRRIPKLGALINPATLLKFHKALGCFRSRLPLDYDFATHRLTSPSCPQRAASDLGSDNNAHTSTAYPYVGCSITPSLENRYRNTSAPTTTHCSASTAGSPTCASSRSSRSSRFRTFRSRIRSSNG